MKKIIHIAIADDYPTLVMGLKFILDSFEHCKVIIEAYDGKSLIEQIESSKIKPAICFLDINMPIMDGYEVLTYLHKKWPSIKVIILSQYFNDYVVIRTLREGAAACLPKEVGMHELKSAITSVIKKGYYHSEYVTKNILETSLTPKGVSKINAKELAFLKHCCSDLSYVEIAKVMTVSPRTVDGYRDQLFDKLGVGTRTALVMFAIKSGLVFLENSFSGI